jgi:multidrug efflux system membrane fusion protein
MPDRTGACDFMILRLAVLAILVAFPAAAQQTVAVTTDPAVVGQVPIEILANGTVQSESVVTVRTRVDGQITHVHVIEGQAVRRGQLLFTLDARLNQALLAQQEAQLVSARAAATRTQLDAARYQSLRGESYASQQRFEQAQADAAAAAANVLATQAITAQTRLNIEFASITSEVDGVLGSLPLRVGNFVRQADTSPIPLATITQTNPILVQFNVPERWLPTIRRATASGNPVPVRAQADGDTEQPVEGQLVFVDSQVDVNTGTITLKARFNNDAGRLWPGQYVQIMLAPAVEDNAILIAAAAVQLGQQGRFVFVMDGNVARRRSVQVSRIVGDRAVVRGQIANNEKIIVEGAQRVSDGTRVEERAVTGAANARVSALEAGR